MALQLFRLAAATPTASNTNYDYFCTATADISLTSGVSHTIALSKWCKGDGVTATAFASATGYNLCINGVMQQSGLYTVNNTSDITLVAPASGLDISQNSPLTLNAINTTIAPTEVAVP